MAREKQAPTIRDPADAFQRDSRDVIRRLNDSPLLKGVLSERVNLTTGVTRVPHSLGRVPIGFLVIDSTADVRVWRAATQAASATELPLTANVSATVSLWIF